LTHGAVRSPDGPREANFGTRPRRNEDSHLPLNAGCRVSGTDVGCVAGDDVAHVSELRTTFILATE